MKIEINEEFNNGLEIGDIVYPIQWRTTKGGKRWFVRPEAKITRTYIIFNFPQEERSSLNSIWWFCLDYIKGGMCTQLTSDCLFATKEEAEAECDRRNDRLELLNNDFKNKGENNDED